MDIEPNHVRALRRAVEIAGSQAKLAEGIASFLDRPSVKQPTISYWLSNQVLLDAEWWPAIEHVTRGHATLEQVTRHELRPDVFPRDQVA